MKVKNCGVIALLALYIMAIFAATAHAATPTFSLTATPVKTAYYLCENVSVNTILSWADLAQNYTVDLQVWNSTDALATLQSGIAVATENGTVTGAYSVAGLTAKLGSATYYVKAVEESTGLAIASAAFTINVQDKSVSMSVAWADASGDRVIDPQESVTCTVYISWAFLNATINTVLKVNDNGFEKVLDNVALSAGSGSAQKTYVTSFDVAGVKTLTFTLEDAAGKTVATKAVTLTVGNVQTATTTQQQGSIMDTVNTYANKYLGIILVFVVIAVIVLLWKRR